VAISFQIEGNGSNQEQKPERELIAEVEGFKNGIK
jgi:hypothetical protein